MSKLMIPAILVATIMVAGIFAFMPVQQASTVHDTIQTNVDQLSFEISGAETFTIVDFGNQAQNNADVFGAQDDGVLLNLSIAGQGRILITAAAFDAVECDVFVTVTDDDDALNIVVNDVEVITGADLNDEAFFQIPLGEKFMDTFTIDVDLDGDDADACDDVGLTMEIRGKVLRS